MRILSLLLLACCPLLASEGFNIVLRDGSIQQATTGVAIEDNMLLFKDANGNIVKMSKLMVDWNKMRQISPKVFAIAAPDSAKNSAAQQQRLRQEKRREIVIDNKKLAAMDEDTGLIREATFIEVDTSQTGSKERGTVRSISNGEKVDVTKYLVSNTFTIFDFYADWCGPCRILTPELESFVKDHNTKSAMRKVNIKTFETDVAKQYEIEAIPYVMVFNNNGRLFFKGNGFEALEKLKEHARNNKW